MKRKRIPYFEAFVTMLSYYLAVALMFNNDLFSQLPDVYGALVQLGSETVFVFVFFFAATVKVIGLIINCNMLRKIGLSLSALIYLVIAVSYVMSAVPLNWGTGIFFLLFAFSLLNIFEVKHTKLIE